jgi:biotin carboxyl carrier protein
MSATRLAVTAAGRTHVVSLEPTGVPDRYRVRVDDEPPVEIDAIAAGQNAATTWSLRDTATGAVSVAALDLGGNGEADVHVDGHAIPVSLEGRRGRRKGALAGGDGEQRILAPMPGKVLKVLVKPGDEVAARQGLVVVEAMKMENELTAARAGVVREVSVSEGASVEAGRLLVVVA